MERLVSMGTKLLCKETGQSAFTQIPNVKGYPSFLGEAERVETTCVEDTQKTYGRGQSDPGEMAFTLAYTGMGPGSNWARLREVESSGAAAAFQVQFPDGSGFQWEATVALSMNEVGDGNSPLEFTANMFPTGEVTPINELPAA